MTRIRTQIKLMGTVDPDHITIQLKTKPDESWSPGDSIEHTQLTHGNYGWVLDSGWDESLDLGKQAQETIDRLTYRIGLLQQWAANNRQKLELELSCAVDIEDQAPAINFSPTLLQRAASLSMSIDVDVYVSETHRFGL